MRLQRHDMVLFKQDAAIDITKKLLKYHNINECNVVLSEWYLLLVNGLIPGIVRRDDDADRINKGDVPIGISLPLRVDGQRVRFACWIAKHDILRVITPFQVPVLPFRASTKSLTVLKALMDEWPLAKSNLGIWGANALEIITGLNYTDAHSDLDIIICPEEKKALNNVYHLIELLEKKFQCRIDAELRLDNNYGVSLKEFFQQNKYILGKCLTDVSLLNKSDLSIII